MAALAALAAAALALANASAAGAAGSRATGGGGGGGGAPVDVAAPPGPSVPEGPAGPPAPGAGRAVAPRAAVPAATTNACPAAPYGPQYYAPGSGRTVALTFDDGPGASTAAVLAVLRAAHVPATFFNIGRNAAVAPAAVRTELADGFAMGNHTWDHPDLATLSAAAQASEIDRATAEQVAETGAPPCGLRPPYGAADATTYALAQQRHLAVWDWSVDTEDWKAEGSGSSYWVQRIVGLAEQEGGAQQHPVVLMHDAPVGNPATVAALPTIISFFRDRGYRFVTLFRTGTPVPPPPPYLTAPGPAAAATTAGLHALARGAAGNLVEHTFAGTWGAPRSLGGLLVGSPAAAGQGGALTAAVRGTDGAVWVRSVPDGAVPGPWTSLGGTATSRPAVAATAAGTVVAVRGGGGALWVRRDVAGQPWGPWTSLGGRLLGGPALATAGTTTTVVGVGSDHQAYVRRSTGGAWTPWARIGGTLTADPALTVSPDGSHLLLAVRGGNGGVYVRRGLPDGTGWQPWTGLGGATPTGPAVTAYRTSSVVVVLGTDNRDYEDLSTPAGWTGWRALPFG